jgi:hypothetical protein
VADKLILEAIERVDEAKDLLLQALDKSATASPAVDHRNLAAVPPLGTITDLESDEAWVREYRFLHLVAEYGDDGVDVHTQRRLMVRVGYSPQASGGFFGGNEPSLRRDPATDQRYITEDGRRRLEFGREKYGALIDLPTSDAGRDG